MTYEAYKKDLTDQIGNKRAKKMVMQEIDNHIEELTDQFEQEGINHDAALEKAVKEMGDPSETGMELNRIHRPRFPYLMFGMVIFLTLFGILLQSRIIPVLNNDRMNHEGMSQMIMYSVLGIAIAFIIVFFDYSVIVKNAYKLWGGYLVMIVLIRFITNLPIWNSVVMLLSSLVAMFPILFAALIYRQRGGEWKGILKCMAMLWLSAVFTMVFGSLYSFMFLAETVLICLLMLIVAILKGVMGKQKKCMLALTILPPLAAIGAYVIRIMPLAAYQRTRIDVLLHPENYINEYGYTTIGIRKLLQQFTAGGNKSFGNQTDILPSMQMHTDYAVTSMFTWFGIVAGTLILVLLFAFCVYSLWMSMRQNNRISFLFGTMCSITLLVHCSLYVLSNFGIFTSFSTYFPFLKFGLSNAVVNGCYIGIIMCVYRNSNILGECVENTEPVLWTGSRKKKKKFIKKLQDY